LYGSVLPIQLAPNKEIGIIKITDKAKPSDGILYRHNLYHEAKIATTIPNNIVKA